MRRTLPAVAFLLLTLTNFGAQQALAHRASATATAPTQDPQAIAVLHRALAALGAAGAASIKDTVIQATATPAPDTGGSPGNLTITTKSNYLMRTDVSGATKNASVIYNAGREFRSADHGWLGAPGANAHHKRIEHLPALMLNYELGRGDVSAVYVGQETIEGIAVHHIRVARVSQRGDSMDGVLTGNTQLDLFIDAQTFLLVKIAFPLMSEIDWRISFPVEIYYDQYQTVNGIAVPYRQRYFFNGKPTHELHITSVAINQGIPDSTFEAR